MAWITVSDWKLGLRLARKQPIMTLTSVLALAVGIGLATVGFTMVDAAFHGRLPFDGGDRFVRLPVEEVPSGRPAALDHERYRLLAASATTLAHVGALAGGSVNRLYPSGKVEPLGAAYLTPGSFRFLPYAPRLGRALTAADGAPGAPPVVVLGERYWQRAWGGDREVVGRTIDLAGTARTVVGVMGEDFVFPGAADVWLPLDERTLGGTEVAPRRGVRAFGVLADGVPLVAAQAEVAALATAWEENPADTATRIRLASYTEPPRGLGVFGSSMVAVLVMVLLVIASNVANLILARASARTGELAVRAALGAPRRRLIGQLTVEVLLLGGAAAAIGLAAAAEVVKRLDAALTEKPVWLAFDISPRAMVFVVAVTLVSCAIAGIVPALKATRRDPSRALQARGRSVSGLGLGRLGATMMVVEMALSVALLSGALVAARGFAGFLGEGLDLPDDAVLTAQVLTGPNEAAAAGVTDPDGMALPERIARALEAMPGVRVAGTTTVLPRQDGPVSQVLVEPPAGEAEATPVALPVASVGAGFLDSLAPAPVAGRLLETRDQRPGAPPVAVVNEPFVRTVLGGRNALGRRVRVVDQEVPDAPPVWHEIVGVVPDLGLSMGDPERAAGLYLPLVATPAFFYLAMRVEGDPSTFAGPLRSAVAAIDPDIGLRRIAPLGAVNAEEVGFLAGLGTTLTAVGALALLLSVAGLYAMLSFAVARRTCEIGVRVALGASRRQVLRAVAGRAALFLAAGAALGAVLAPVFVRVQDAMLVSRLPASEPWIVPLVVFVLGAAGVAACIVPVRRALSIQAAEALRLELATRPLTAAAVKGPARRGSWSWWSWAS